jgi:phospholipase C
MAKPNLTHVVVLMLENRSFDHVLGLLPGVDGVAKKPFSNLFNPQIGSAFQCGFNGRQLGFP